LTALVDRNSLDPGTVDDVLIGCVSQAGEQSATPGRQAWLAAGYPTHVPSVSIERKCGSGQQAVEFAAWGIAAGVYDIAIAGGVESMSRVPMGSARMGADPFGPGVRRRFPDLVPQGVSAELVADKWGISRRALDEYSAESHRRAAATRDAAAFDHEIVAVPTESGMVRVDETIRDGTTVDRLAGLQPAFATDSYRDRFPSIDWKVTAGNSSQITDGASALLLMSEERAAALGLRPRAQIIASAVCGDDPTLMLTGPIPATHKVLERAKLSISDIDAVEINEAFASVPLAWQAEFAADPTRVNPRGGAIALGHPLGASGARLMTTLLNHLEQSGGRLGLQTMCEAGGMANATIIEVL
jgi:acetyl-CoA C-acetyltransferase/acetyl-CoA acyltransferase